MRFIAYADMHFNHSWPEFNPVEANGLNRWLNIQINVWKQIDDYAQQYKAEKLFAGDLTHKRSFIHTTAINSILDLYKNSKIKEFLIPGNHDRYDQKIYTVQAVNGIGEAVVLANRHVLFNEGIIFGIDPGGAIPKPERDSFKILLAHGTLQGASAPSEFEFTSGYKLEDFKDWDLVILGDIHKKQICRNVLIPGAPMQQNWGDLGQECGCWLIDTNAFDFKSPSPECDANDFEWTRIAKTKIGVMFLPIKAPKFIVVTKENVEEVLNQEEDKFNYYDFRFAADIDQDAYKEIRERFPFSYFSVKRDEKKVAAINISSKENSQEEILDKYYDLRIKGTHKEEFKALALKYLATADPSHISRSHRNLELKYIKAENFLSFKEVFLDFRQLPNHLYQITGSSDDETSTTNNIGKSTLGVEILSWVLFNQVARSATRSKNRLIHDPKHTGKGKNLFGEVALRIGGTTDFIIQRYRAHTKLGTGSRILRKV